jgi:hypothetical protein
MFFFSSSEDREVLLQMAHTSPSSLVVVPANVCIGCIYSEEELIEVVFLQFGFILM